MATEAQRQQQLLNSGFLNGIGSNNAPVKLDEVERVFVKWMGKLVQEVVKRIDEPGIDGREITATGNLSSKIRFEFTKAGTAYNGRVYMPDYADLRDKGVRGVGANNQNTTSPYRFKFKNPSKKHVAAIEQWIKDKNNLAIVTAPKGLTDVATQQKTLSYIIAKSSKFKGIKAANFKKGAVDSILPDFTKELAAAMAKDISISFDLSSAR